MIFQVGITGGIGAGKSLAAKVFSILGIPVYDADSRAKWLMAHHAPLREAIAEAFGRGAYGPDGQLDRRYLAERVFASGEQVRRLNALVHPRVADDARQWAERQAGHAPYVLREAALMFESGSYRQLQRCVVVHAPQALRLQRTLRRDPQRTEAEVLHIMAKQWTDEQRLALADAVLYNDGSQLLLPQILNLHERFCQEAAAWSRQEGH
jgi:dephospho-CoA kinase